MIDYITPERLLLWVNSQKCVYKNELPSIEKREKFQCNVPCDVFHSKLFLFYCFIETTIRFLVFRFVWINNKKSFQMNNGTQITSIHFGPLSVNSCIFDIIKLLSLIAFLMNSWIFGEHTKILKFFTVDTPFQWFMVIFSRGIMTTRKICIIDDKNDVVQNIQAIMRQLITRFGVPHKRTKATKSDWTIRRITVDKPTNHTRIRSALAEKDTASETMIDLID